MSRAFAPLRAELDLWSEAGRLARFWLRDDDAIEPTPALDRLLAIAGDAGFRPLIAVIPAKAGPGLASRLAGTAADVAQHGWSHANHAMAGDKASEFGAARPHESALADIGRGRERLAAVFGARPTVFVPPWNRISEPLVAALPGEGFSAVSQFAGAPRPPVASLARLDCDLDIIDWRASRRGHPVGRLVGELVELLAARRRGADAPVGVLTHHLVHGEEAWAFLDGLAATLAAHPAARWISFAAGWGGGRVSRR